MDWIINLIKPYLVPYKKLLLRKISRFNKNVKSEEDGNKLIKKLIDSNEPFMVSRLGVVELNTLIENTKIKKGKMSVYSEKTKYKIQNNAGVFPNTNEVLDSFSDTYFKYLKYADVMGVWYNIGEDYICNTHCENATLIKPKGIEPYYFSEPWIKSLEGKTVLVIHPYEESIKNQYKVIDKIFEPNIIPNFKLKTIKAVQSLGGTNDFKDWIEAFNSMTNQIDNIEFDIAIIGAGGYGLPLAGYCKSIGKQAIHMGGATQLLFGIKGKRWDNNPEISKFFNEYWIRPSECEKPKNYNNVENGCYW